jgi:hypothetical protein
MSEVLKLDSNCGQGHLSHENDRADVEPQAHNASDDSVRAFPITAPTTQAAQAALPKKTVDRSQFVSKSQPATGPSEAKQTKFPIRKPGSKLFFRASQDSDARMYVDVIEGEMGKAYVVGANVTRDARLDKLVLQHLLVPCINERGQVFVWHIKTSGRDWYKSALEMINEAETQWIRTEADSFAQAFRFEDASAYPDLERWVPEWPVPPSEVLDVVLGSSAINDDNDPVLLDLIGRRRKKAA